MNLNLATLLCLFSLATLSTNVAAHDCLEYEPAVVTLTGTIIRETHPGPPNYEDITNGDEPETIWVLRLNKSICLKPGSSINEAENHIQEIQLVLKPEQYVQYRNLVGRKVSASGALFHNQTGHHHKKVLLRTDEIKRTHNRPLHGIGVVFTPPRELLR